MPIAVVGGSTINYEIVAPQSSFNGNTIALSPGGRSPLADISALADLLSASGYRVLLHDRRNCGLSDVGFDPTRSEFEMWADDLHDLLRQLELRSAILAGSSSGARLALTYALRYPKEVSALLLIRVTGGRFAVERLVEKYYDSNARAAEQGGMAAVCQTEHFSELIRNRPAIRDQLMALSPQSFIACMAAWRKPFLAGLDLPLIGTTAADLASLAMPVCIIPGNDLTHPRARGALVAPMIPGAELFHVTDDQSNVDVTPPDEWKRHFPAMAAIFTGFLKRRL